MATETIIRATISMDENLRNQINALADKDKRSFSQMAAILLQEAIDKRKTKS